MPGVSPGPPGTYVGTAPASVAIGDLNGDGKPDLVVTNLGDKTVSVLLGNGDGTFTPAPGSPLAVGFSPVYVAIGELNGDGKPDLVVANRGSDSVSILLGNGDGTFTAKSPVPVGSGPTSLAIADLNRDGKPDLVVTNGGVNSVSVLLGK